VSLPAIPANIVGASKLGLRLSIKVPIEPGTVIKIKWDHTIIVGEARHCRQTGPGTYCVGLKISNVRGRGKLRTLPGAG